MLNRRNALKLSLGASALAVAPLRGGSTDSFLSDEIKDDGKHLSLSKHGNLRGDRVFLWSVLEVVDKSGFLKTINAILDGYKYRSELKYSSGDRYKVEPTFELLNYISRNKGIQFNMIQFESDPRNFKDIPPYKFDKVIQEYYTKLSIGKESSSQLLMKCENRYGPSDKHAEQCGVSLGKEIKAINAKNDRLLQLNNLVSGIVYSFFKEGETKNENKVRINKYFDKQYNISEQIGKEVIELPSIMIRKVKF